jgi:hypothetical protein
MLREWKFPTWLLLIWAAVVGLQVLYLLTQDHSFPPLVPIGVAVLFCGLIVLELGGRWRRLRRERKVRDSWPAT